LAAGFHLTNLTDSVFENQRYQRVKNMGGLCPMSVTRRLHWFS